MYYIYMHVNITNNKAYIGYTKTTVEKRFRNHCAYARRNSEYLFHRAIRKYGENMWETSVLEVVDTLQEAKDTEMKHIAAHKTNQRNTGYNMTAGGEGNSCIGKKLSPEHKEKVVAALRSYKPTKEEYARRGFNRRGEKRSEDAKSNIKAGIRAARANGNTESQTAQLTELHRRTKGSKRTQETKDKISAALTGKLRKTKLSAEHITEILVSKLTRKELAAHYNVDPGTITTYKKRFKDEIK